MSCNQVDLVAMITEFAATLRAENANITPYDPIFGHALLGPAVIADGMAALIGRLNAMEEQMTAMQSGFNIISAAVQPKLSTFKDKDC